MLLLCKQGFKMLKIIIHLPKVYNLLFDYAIFTILVYQSWKTKVSESGKNVDYITFLWLYLSCLKNGVIDAQGLIALWI